MATNTLRRYFVAGLLVWIPLVITIHGLHSLRRSNTIAVRFLNRRVMRRASVVMVL
jgi:uncharacterized membrane protein